MILRRSTQHQKMKIETCENTSIAAIVIVAFICIVVGCLGGCRICEETNRKAIDAGLVQKTATSQTTTVWGKP